MPEATRQRYNRTPIILQQATKGTERTTRSELLSVAACSPEVLLTGGRRGSREWLQQDRDARDKDSCGGPRARLPPSHPLPAFSLAQANGTGWPSGIGTACAAVLPRRDEDDGGLKKRTTAGAAAQGHGLSGLGRREFTVVVDPPDVDAWLWLGPLSDVEIKDGGCRGGAFPTARRNSLYRGRATSRSPSWSP